MTVGETWRIFIHPDLAYGEAGRPGIPANSALIFEITLHSISSS
jgi:FKBP-type peptidyl-prolyl cis-trans isomerase